MVRKIKKKNKEKTIEFSKTLSQLRKGTTVSECLWNEDDCDNTIVNAHSIQNNRYLNKISENGKIFSLKFGITEENDLIWDFEETGRNTFSTFKGFCKKHDKELFQLIEDRKYEYLKEQNFLFAFRALAKEYHAKKESVNYHTKLLNKLKDNSNFEEYYLKSPRLKHVLNLDEVTLNIYKDEFFKLKEQIKHKTYNGIKTLVLKLDKEYPVVCNSTFIPYTTFENKRIFNEEEYDKIQTGELNPSLFLNIFPESGETIILISYLEEYESYVERYLKDFDNISQEELKNRVSTMAIQYCENIGFSPEYIREKFTDNEIEKIKKVYSENISNTLYTSGTAINLFK